MKRKNQNVQHFAMFFWAFALLLLVCAPRSSSQTVTGSILGTVKDSQGSTVPNATVTARSDETGAERSTTTDSFGGFTIVSVPAGAYTLTVTVPGFQTEVQKGLTLTVGAALRVDFSLKVGSVSQQVEVTGEAPQVDTTNATMSGLVDDTSIRELPLNGRDWLQLAVLQTGVTFLTPSVANAKDGSGERMFISGGRSTQNVYRVDGFVVNDYANNSPGNALGINMGVDAIREFSVLSNAFSAEYGRSAGGVINSILKSGTNQFHGSAFYLIRNSAMDARNFFNPPQIPEFRRNQFGSSIGGPIKKDKLFFFADYEGVRLLSPANAATNTISNDARNGLIVCTPSPSDPACVLQSTGVYKQQYTVSPAIVPYLSLFPQPTNPGTGDTGIFTFGAGAPGTDNYVIGKVDYQLNAKNLMTVSYSYDKAQTITPDNYDDKSSLNASRTQTAILSFQHVFSPTVLNTIRTGVNRIFAPQANFVDPTVPAETNPALAWVPGYTMGFFSLPFISSFTPSGLTGNPNAFRYTDPQVSDDLSWVKGRNNIRIGGYFEAINNNAYSTAFLGGQWTFNTMVSFITDTDPAQFESDIPGTSPYRSFRQKVFGAYFVDDLRVTRNLTLNLGIRYEPSTVVKEAYNKTSFLTDLTQGLAQTVIGNPIYSNSSLRNFGPRLGLAWDPFGDGKTSVRAGFGIYDVLLTPNLFTLRLARSYPFYEEGAINNPCPSTTVPCAAFPAGGLALLSPTSLYTMYIQQNPPATYKEQWNFNIQRQLAPGLSLTVGYVGSRGVHLPIDENDTDDVALQYATFVNGNYTFPWKPTSATNLQPVPGIVNGVQISKINPNWSRIQSMRWDGYAIYHALQVHVTQQVRRGLSLNFSYEYSKSMDNGGQEYTSNEFPSSMGNPYPLIPGLQRGLSDFNLTHNMTAYVVYDAPTPHFDMAAARFALSGWELTGILSVKSGSPFSIGIPNDEAATGGFISTSTHVAERPNFNPSAPGCNAKTPQDAVTGNVDGYLNMNCFPYPAPGTLGNLGRNQIVGPGLQNLDFSIYKNHSVLHESLRIQFRAEFFNIFNHPNFQSQFVVPYSYSTTTGVGAPLAASTLNSSFWFGSTVTTSRQIQLGLRFTY